MEISGDAEGLVREIREMARKESEGIVAAAEAEAERIVAEAETETLKARAEMLEAALAAADRRREMLLAAVPAEAGRLRSERLEALLDSIKAEAAGKLTSEAVRAGKRAILAALAAQAIGRMEGGGFTVALATADMDAAPGLPEEIARLAGRGALEISIEESPGLDGGVVVRDAEGRQHWDNSFKARLERFWPELRGRLMPPENKDESRGK